MKLIASLDRACERRMALAARPRRTLLAVGMLAITALLSLPTFGAMTTDPGRAPETMIATGGLLGLAFAGPLREKEGDDPQGGGGKKLTIGEKLAAAQAEVTTLTGRISSLETDLAAAKAASETSAGELTKLKADLAAKEKELAAAQAELKTATEAKSTADAEVEKLKAEAKTADQRALEKIQQLGFSGANLPPSQDGNADNDLPASSAELETELAKLSTHREKSALIRRYEAARSGKAA